MQCDVTSFVISISNRVQNLDQEKSYKNSTKEVVKNYWAKFRVTGISTKLVCKIYAVTYGGNNSVVSSRQNVKHAHY